MAAPDLIVEPVDRVGRHHGLDRDLQRQNAEPGQLVEEIQVIVLLID